MTVRIKTRSLLARLAAAQLKSKRVAVVLGKTIHLWNVSKEEFLSDEKWLAHELTHVLQYKHYGFLSFIFRYLMESLKHGYYNNKFEREARENEIVSKGIDQFQIS